MGSSGIGHESVVLGGYAPEDCAHESDHGAGCEEERRRRFLEAVSEVHAEHAGNDGARGQGQSPHLHEERHPDHAISNGVQMCVDELVRLINHVLGINYDDFVFFFREFREVSGVEMRKFMDR